MDWREFDQNPVSHSAAHHLTAIQQLLEDQGYARVSDVARKLGITRGSVSVSLKGLRQRGLVVEDQHKHLGLSDEGQRIARGIHTKRVLFKAFLEKSLDCSQPKSTPSFGTILETIVTRHHRSVLAHNANAACLQRRDPQKRTILEKMAGNGESTTGEVVSTLFRRMHHTP